MEGWRGETWSELAFCKFWPWNEVSFWYLLLLLFCRCFCRLATSFVTSSSFWLETAVFAGSLMSCTALIIKSKALCAQITLDVTRYHEVRLLLLLTVLDLHLQVRDLFIYAY